MSVMSGGRAHSQIRDRIVGLRRVRAHELLPNPKNWRRHPKAQAEALRGLLGEIGYADALLARETPDGLMLIDGHLRAETTPDVEVPVLVLDLDEAEADKLLLTLDPLAAMAEMDGPATKALLEGVETESEAVQTMLAGLRDQAQKAIGPEEGLTDPDAVPEVVEPVAKRGDVWVCGDHRVMCGDSTDAEDVARLMAGEKAAMMFADPPYGIEYLSSFEDPTFAKGAHCRTDGARVPGDSQDFDLEAALEITMGTLILGGPWYVCACTGPDQLRVRQALRRWNLRQGLVWVKHRSVFGKSDYHLRHEALLYGWRQGSRHRWFSDRGQDSVWEFAGPQRSPEHPTMKPVALVERAIGNSSQSGNLVLDPFLGSGTTMIAAERLGRRCYGMEIEPRYVDVAVRRWEDFTGRKAERERARTKAKAHA